MRTTRKKSLLVVLCAVGLMVAGVVPAAAATASSARAYGFGLDVTVAGTPVLEQLASCTAEIPPELEAFCEDTVVEVPAEGVINSATVHTENQVAAAGGLTAPLKQEIEDFAGAAAPTEDLNAVGYSVTEALSLLEGTVTADIIEGNANAGCVSGQPVFSSGANVGNLALAETQILADLLDALAIDASPVLNLTQAPNTVVVDLSPLLKITFWETNWDGATGVTDGGDTVFVNALRIEALTTDSGQLLDLATLTDLLGGIDLLDPNTEVTPEEIDAVTSTADIRISHAEASAGCAPDNIELGKTASKDVVSPGETFDYTITVPNNVSCTYTNVRVEDTITGPAGFEITATNPPADTVDATGTTASIIWNDIGPIGPDEAKQLTIGVQVPSNAADGSQFAETLAVTADCDGVPVDGDLVFNGPTVRAAGPQLPRTGGAALVGGLAFMAFGAGLFRLRG